VRRKDEEREWRQAAHHLIAGYLEFSTLRYYAPEIRATETRPNGDVLVTMVLRVPMWEVREQLAKEPQKAKPIPGLDE